MSDEEGIFRKLLLDVMRANSITINDIPKEQRALLDEKFLMDVVESDNIQFVYLQPENLSNKNIFRIFEIINNIGPKQFKAYCDSHCCDLFASIPQDINDEVYYDSYFFKLVTYFIDNLIKTDFLINNFSAVRDIIEELPASAELLKSNFYYRILAKLHLAKGFSKELVKEHEMFFLENYLSSVANHTGDDDDSIIDLLNLVDKSFITRDNIFFALYGNKVRADNLFAKKVISNIEIRNVLNKRKKYEKDISRIIKELYGF